MLKILFREFAELAQGDGKGPKYYPGKAYWLTPDQAVRWKAEGVAEDAPADMPAENEEARGPAPLRPENVRIVRTKGNRYNVVGPDDYKFNREPISAADAERLRKDVLEGKVTMSGAEPALAFEDHPKPGLIELRQVVDANDVKTVYAVNEWPATAQFSNDLLTDKALAPTIVVDGDVVTVTVANGRAVYTLGPDDGFARLGTLSESTFEAMPPE